MLWYYLFARLSICVKKSLFCHIIVDFVKYAIGASRQVSEQPAFRSLSCSEMAAHCVDQRLFCRESDHPDDFTTWFTGPCFKSPDLHFVGGLFLSRSVSAVGSTFTGALRRAIGEAAEIMALSESFSGARARPDSHLFTHCLRISSDEPGAVPKFSIGSKPPNAIPLPATSLEGKWMPPPNEGCGAAPEFRAAWQHGALELVERDAMALWWYGGRSARRLASLEHDLLPAEQNQILLLDVTALEGLPTVAAIWFDDDGLMYTCGSAAALTTKTAAVKALFELHQMLTGHIIIRQKILQLGLTSLNPKDINTIKLATQIHRNAVMSEAVDVTTNITCSDTSSDLYDRLTAADVRMAILDLGWHLGLRVAKAVSPDLQPSVHSAETARLRDAISSGSGSFTCFSGLSLF